MIVSEAFRFFFRSRLLTTEYWTPEARHQHNITQLYNSISLATIALQLIVLSPSSPFSYNNETNSYL